MFALDAEFVLILLIFWLLIDCADHNYSLSTAASVIKHQVHRSHYVKADLKQTMTHVTQKQVSSFRKRNKINHFRYLMTIKKFLGGYFRPTFLETNCWILPILWILWTRRKNALVLDNCTINNWAEINPFHAGFRLTCLMQTVNTQIKELQ